MLGEEVFFLRNDKRRGAGIDSGLADGHLDRLGGDVSCHRQRDDNGYAENAFQHGWPPSIGRIIFPGERSCQGEVALRMKASKDEGLRTMEAN